MPKKHKDFMAQRHIDDFMDFYGIERNFERDICERLVSTNMNVKEIARSMGKTENTISTASSEIYAQTNASCRLGLMTLYQQFLEYLVDEIVETADMPGAN